MRRWGLAIFVLLAASTGWAQNGTHPLVQRAGEQISALLAQMSDVKCTELVTQTRLKPNGKTEYEEQARFDYLVTIEATAGDVVLSESRLSEQEPRRARNLPMLVTNGFSTLFLIFHPFYQSAFEFALGEGADGVLVPVRFRHIAGRKSPTVLVLRNREYPLDLEGTAWIEPQSGRIAKMSATLGASLEDLGVKQLRSDVTYAPVKLRGTPADVWFPILATIEVETPKQHWRNTHRFTDYKQFSVSTEEVIAKQP